MKRVLSIFTFVAVLSLLAAFTADFASAGEYGYYGGGYYDSGCCGSCCGRGLLTSPRVYVVPAQPVYVVPAQPAYVEDYGYRRYRGPVYYESNRHYRPRGYYYRY